MSRWKGLRARARSFVARRAAESRMHEEFSFHLEMETARLVAEAKLDPADARRRALATFGGVATHGETMREQRGVRWLADIGADIRYAVRGIRRAPGFAIAVALTLGIGIGVNGIVFGYVDALLFRPIPAHAPAQLVSLFTVDARSGRPDELSYEDYLDFRDRSGAFDGLAGFTGLPLNLVATTGSTAAADMIFGEMVTENFFAVLGMRPALGRLFIASDAPQGANPFAVLSYECWQRRFHGDSSVVGRRVRVNGAGFTIVGVAPRGFRGMRTFGFWSELWVPVGMHDVVMPGSADLLTGRGRGWMMTVGRMRSGATMAATQRTAARFARALAEAYPATNHDLSALVIPAATGFDNPSFVKPRVLALASALGLFAALMTLAVVCANLANLQLARVSARSREIAIRRSLGCSRARLVRQTLVESVVVALPGIALATAALRASPLLESWMLPHLQFRVGFDPAVNARIVAFTAVVAGLAVLVCGVAPSLRAGRETSVAHLVGAARTVGTRRRMRGALVIAQLALSVVLLVSATLFARSLVAAQSVDLGFDASDRALLSVNVTLQGYDRTQARRFYDATLARVRATPGVASATWAFPVPFDTYGRSIAVYVDASGGRVADRTSSINATVADEDFVNALGLHLVSGRGFSVADSSGTPRVIVVSHRLAARLWPGRDPLGRHLRRAGPDGPEMTVVGVVADATFGTIGETGEARAYVPLRQEHRGEQTLVVHTRGDPNAMLPTLASIVRELDPALPVYGRTTMARNVSGGFSLSRTAASIAGFFGVMALLISTVGLYAVVASGVTERTREIGVRVALGSSPRDVMRVVMRGGARLGLVGLALGLIGAVVMARAMGSLLYGLSPVDPLTFGAVPVVLAIVVVLATYVPARRAVRLDPMAALRSD